MSMQQIDEIRRMSELAKQLRERGLAKDSLDALNQARGATSSDPAVAKQRQEELQQERIALLERKVTTQQQRIEELQQQLAATVGKLSDLNGQLSSLSKKIRDVEIASTASIPPIQSAWQQPAQVPAPTWQAAPPQAANWQQTAERPPSTQAIDRNGVAPADVSVEKFFYFGKR
jgi:uncharacterized coiled-coil protein SlyX